MRPALANIITSRVPEADLLIDTMTVRPQGNRAFLISDTIRRLKAANIWSRLDVLWMLAAHDAQAGRLNWKDPSRFALTAVNSPTFAANRGYTGNGTTSYLDTNWNPATNGVGFTQNNAHIAAWNRTSRAAGVHCLASVAGTASDTSIFPRYTGDVAFMRVNDNPATSGLSDASSVGLFHADRQSSTARTGYHNGVSAGSYGSSASGTLISRTMVALALRYDSAVPAFSIASTDQIAMLSAGSSLDSVQAAFYHTVQTYMSRIGA